MHITSLFVLGEFSTCVTFFLNFFEQDCAEFVSFSANASCFSCHSCHLAEIHLYPCVLTFNIIDPRKYLNSHSRCKNCAPEQLHKTIFSD